MTLAWLVMQNLRRNRVRTALTAIAFALPMGIVVLALSLVVDMATKFKGLERELRLAVHSKITLMNFLPDGVRRQIEDLDRGHARLQAVCGMRWFGGRVPDSQLVLQALASDKDTLPVVYDNLALAEEELAAWEKQKDAAIPAKGIAEQMHWKVGDRVRLESTIPPYMNLDFTIIKIWETSPFPTTFYFRRDYLADSFERQGFTGAGCNVFWVKCADAAALRSLQTEIDALFANTPDPTKSEDESAFVAFFMQAIGDLPGLLRTIALVVVFIIALVAGNTMMMSFRERMRELAVFKAIGFQARRVFTIVLGESVLLALAGSLIGILPVWAILALAPRRWLTFRAFSAPEPSPAALAAALGIGLAVGVLAGAWPAWQALRLRTTRALRTV